MFFDKNSLFTADRGFVDNLLPYFLLFHITQKFPVFLPRFVPFSETTLPYPSQSAKTYDSPAVKSIFALLLEEVTRPKQAYPEGRNALKK